MLCYVLFIRQSQEHQVHLTIIVSIVIKSAKPEQHQILFNSNELDADKQ